MDKKTHSHIDKKNIQKHTLTKIQKTSHTQICTVTQQPILQITHGLRPKRKILSEWSSYPATGWLRRISFMALRVNLFKVVWDTEIEFPIGFTTQELSFVSVIIKTKSI